MNIIALCFCEWILEVSQHLWALKMHEILVKYTAGIHSFIHSFFIYLSDTIECPLCSRFFFLLKYAAATAAKLLQSCAILCNPTDSSPPGSPVPGILQARTLEWVAISFSNAWKWRVKVKLLSRVRPSATPWTAAYQDPPSLGFSRWG